MSTWTCATCTSDGRHGYCAPLRCYCGHKTCHAHASWEPLPEPADITPPKERNKKRNAWAERTESTWIDGL